MKDKDIKKVAVVTGATSGIGLCVANRLLKNGYTVYGIARRQFSGGFECFCADVCDHDRTAEILKTVYEREGRIDVLVNNAGMGVAGAIDEISADNIKTICDVNLTALCVLCSQAVPYIREGGKIINVSSVGGIIPLPYQALYSATKAGVEVFSRAIATELKPKKIKVCAILPGDTKTGFTAARICEGENKRAERSVKKMEHDEQHGKSPEYVAKVICKQIKRKKPPLRVSVGGLSKFEVFLAKTLPVRFVNFVVSKIYG
ncbi:MAG: SDR family NAD(P)-dependent oxidoreductase [Clostridia bacterium]|nr:SDR family NAD(P)-dependent oxidoreductase [Clostridia bacterium]